MQISWRKKKCKLFNQTGTVSNNIRPKKNVECNISQVWDYICTFFLYTFNNITDYV